MSSFLPRLRFDHHFSPNVQLLASLGRLDKKREAKRNKQQKEERQQEQTEHEDPRPIMEEFYKLIEQRR